MAIKATKLTAALLSGAMVIAFAPAVPAAVAQDAAGTGTESAAAVSTSQMTTAQLKTVTSDMFNNETLAQIKDYVDANNSKELVAGMIGEVYIHPKTTPKAQAEQKTKVNKMANGIEYAYKKLSKSDRQNIPAIPEGNDANGNQAYEYPGAAGADYMSTANGVGSAKKDKAQTKRLSKKPNKKKEVLVVSFGTSYNTSRYKTIGGVERAIEKKYKKNWSVRRAFTSQVIINHVRTRDGYWIDTVREAMNKAKKAGVKKLVVQPTTLMSGIEYALMKQNVKSNSWKGLKVKYAEPLLGMSTSTKKSDVKNAKKYRTKVAKLVANAAAKKAGYKKMSSKKAKKVAFVFMGHGTEDAASVTYANMQKAFKKLGYKNVFVSTVESNPPSTSFAKVVKRVKKAGYKKVILRPLMVVAGDHAHNDMAGSDDDSLKSTFIANGFKAKNIKSQINGLGEIAGVQDLYIAHTTKAMKALK